MEQEEPSGHSLEDVLTDLLRGDHAKANSKLLDAGLSTQEATAALEGLQKKIDEAKAKARRQSRWRTGAMLALPLVGASVCLLLVGAVYEIGGCVLNWSIAGTCVINSVLLTLFGSAALTGAGMFLHLLLKLLTDAH